MVAQPWLYLPLGWALQNVVSVVNVVVSTLSMLAITVYVQVCWRLGARAALNGRSTPLPRLLPVGSLEEALEMVGLLHSRILHKPYLPLLGQCAIVAFFTLTGLLSGPIANYATNLESTFNTQEVSSFLSERKYDRLSYAAHRWSATYERLELADFPMDQLLDFLPNVTLDWVHRQEYFNGSWKMNCNTLGETPVRFRTSADCSTELSPYPNLNQTFNVKNWTSYSTAFGGMSLSDDGFGADAFLVVYGSRKSEYDKATESYHTMSFVLATYSLHSFHSQMASTINETAGEPSCAFESAPVDRVLYTKIECNLQRQWVNEDSTLATYPDMPQQDPLVNQLLENFLSSSYLKGNSKTSLVPPTPWQMIRAYQTWMVIKDTLGEVSDPRQTWVRLEAVQISIIFVSVVVIILTMIMLGYLDYGVFYCYHRKARGTVPETKLDWALQSIRLPKKQTHDACGNRLKMVTLQRSLAGIGKKDEKRVKFENAKYGQYVPPEHGALTTVELKNRIWHQDGKEAMADEARPCLPASQSFRSASPQSSQMTAVERFATNSTAATLEPAFAIHAA